MLEYHFLANYIEVSAYYLHIEELMRQMYPVPRGRRTKSIL
jgi:hypothetical protein